MITREEQTEIMLRQAIHLLKTVDDSDDYWNRQTELFLKWYRNREDWLR